MIVANIITDLIEDLDDIAGNWWFLFVILGIAFLDSVIPVVPSETAVILGGLAAYDHGGVSRLLLVILAGASGAFLGDNFAYEVGHRFRPRVERFASTRPKLSNRLDWARAQIRTRGGPLLVTARFIPGGRTALTITSGLTHQPRRWFATWIAGAAVIWATYASLLGYIGKNRFKDNHTAAFLFAFGAAVSITIIIEVVRHIRSRGKPEPGAAVIEEVAEEVVDEVKDDVKDALSD